MIEVTNLSKTFKLYHSPKDRLKEIVLRRRFHTEHQALREIGFEVADGQTLGIIGPNGAGKSTLLKILTGVLLPDAGTVAVDGKITGLLELGTGFNAEMTGLQNIYMNGLLLGMDRQEVDRKLDRIVEFTELGDFIHEPLKTYSSGMTMRLGFSVAIHADPKCFVVDEALSVGDAHFQQKCMARFRKFRDEGGSIIFVSHDLNAVKILCDKAILLHRGQVVEEGDSEKVVNAYNFLLSRMGDKAEAIVLENREKHSYGNFSARIYQVSLRGDHSGSEVVSAGENVTVSVEIEALQDHSEAVVGILFRDRFGQDIFGTNTYHQKLPLVLRGGSRAVCCFRMPLNIGPGKYTITAAVHTKDTHLEECMHWVDNACEFEVAGFHGPFFTGLVRLQPEIHFEEHSA